MTFKIKTFLLFLLLGFVFIQPLYAITTPNVATLIDIAGKQRMLSQKIAKSYFFYGQGIRPEKTNKQMLDSLKLFNKNHEILKANIKNSDIHDMLLYIEISKDELPSIIKAPYSKKNATLMLDYSETLLEASHDIVKRLEASSGTKKEKIVNLSGRQRMLTQRIAKYYIAYQAGFKDKNLIKHLKDAMKEFEAAHKTLGEYKKNTPEINEELNKVARLWNVVNKFFSNVEKGGLPVIVLSTTDKMMASMNRVTKLYVNLLGK